MAMASSALPPPPPGLHFDGVVRPEVDGAMAAYMIPPYLSNHASTIELLPDGTLTAAWFSGEAEEASGCAIVFATMRAGSGRWSPAATLSKRDKYSNQNPVLFYDSTTGILHLFHSQAPAQSGESASQIWHLQSTNGGRNWTKPAPFFVASGDFPRNRIIRRLDGTLLFPYYSQGEGHPNWSVMGVSAGKSVGDNTSWSAHTVRDSSDLVQPSVVRVGVVGAPENKTLTIFFRDRRHEHVYRATSSDEGITWSSPVATTLPNPNAGIEAYNLSDGQVVLAYNPQTDGRDPLAVALSADGGVTWPHTRNVQHGLSGTGSATLARPLGNEFSYPSIIQDGNGTIHMVYTYLRQTIKYKAFTVDWIKKS